MRTERFRLGVDFGTSNTVAVLAGPDGRVRPLVFDGSLLLASAVFAGPGSELLVGADAVRAAVGDPAGLELNPKRRIDDGTVWLGERELPVAEIIAAVLSRVGTEASRVAGRPVDEVVLTHPAAWGRPRLGLLADAASRAGLGEPTFVAEPVAAAAYFASVLDRRVSAGRCVVVYDLGAGTFDVSVVRPGPAGFDVVTAEGLSDVGGLDLDAVVVRHARTLTADAGPAWQRLDWPQSPADQQARQTLWHAARAVKEQLSRHSSTGLHIPLVDRQVHVTREEFEAAARPYLDRTAALTMRVLAEAGIPPENVDGVFLVGGSSRIPLAATTLHRRLRFAPTVIDQPELVVAEGAIHCGSTNAEPVVGPVVPTGPVADTDDHVVPATVTAVAVVAPAEAVQLLPPAADVSPSPPTAPTPAPVTPPRSRTSFASRSRSLAVSLRRRPGRLVSAIAVLAVLATAGVLAVTRPWQDSRTGDGDTAPTARGAELLGDPLVGHTDEVSLVRFSPDGRMLATGSRDTTVRLWDLSSRQHVATLARNSRINGLAFSPDGKILATGSNDKMVRLWDMASRDPIGSPLAGHTDWVYDVVFSPDGTTLATTSFDDTVRLWNVASRAPIGSPLAGNVRFARGVAFSPDGKTLATGGGDFSVRLWDVAGRASIGSPLTGHTSPVYGVAFSPDGGTLASVSGDRMVRLWDVESRRPIGSPLVGHRDVVRDLAFSPDGSILVTVGDDMTLRLWNVTDRRLIATVITGHTHWVVGVAFSRDGQTLATASVDHTVRLWRVTI